MERKERLWLGVLLLVALTFNVVTLSPLIPWQQWLLWSHPSPSQTIPVQFGNYQITLPASSVQVKAGEYVQFVATSKDVTYGLGVFRPDGTLVFQMQVIPGHENKIVWKFDVPGSYDIRSTEYSGPRHPEMMLKSAVLVVP